jgi:hypothetical protein
MKSVEGEFENLYFHDSPVKAILINADWITIDLSFAHIDSEHSQNSSGKVICAKDCQLRFSEVEALIVKVHQDEQNGWAVTMTPKRSDFLLDIVETEKNEAGYYQLSGMTEGAQWSEWWIKAKNVALTWELEGKSWLTKE